MSKFPPYIMSTVTPELRSDSENMKTTRKKGSLRIVKLCNTIR